MCAPKRWVKSHHQVLVNVTFGKRVFEGVIKMSLYWSRMGTNVWGTDKEKDVKTQTHREKSSVKTEAEPGKLSQLRSTKIAGNHP